MEIKNFKAINKGALIAKFDLYFDKMGMSIRDCALMRSGNKEWIGMPSRKYQVPPGQEGAGETKWYAYVIFSSEKRAAFEKKCLELVKPMLGSSTPSPEYDDIPF